MIHTDANTPKSSSSTPHLYLPRHINGFAPEFVQLLVDDDGSQGGDVDDLQAMGIG